MPLMPAKCMLKMLDGHTLSYLSDLTRSYLSDLTHSYLYPVPYCLFVCRK